MNEKTDRTEKTEKLLKTIRTVLVIIMVIAILTVSKAASSVSIRVLLSFFVFLLVLPLVSAMEKAKFPHWLATIIATLVIVTVVAAFLWFVFFTAEMLMDTIPGYASRLEALDKMAAGIAGKWVQLPEDFSLFSSLNVDWIGSLVMPGLRYVSSQAISILSNVLITILMTVFLLGERHVIVPKLINFATDRDGEKVAQIWDRIVRQISKYISIKIFVSILTGVLFYLVAVIVKLDFALLWGVMAVVLNFIPTIGSIIITALMILMAIIQFAPAIGPILFVAISAVAIQNIVGNFLDPRLSGNTLNLSPFIILVGLGTFGFIWGIVGMFLAVPLLSVLQIICANIDATRPIAIMISSGRSYKHTINERNSRRRTTKKTSSQKADYSDEFTFPDRQ